jgi:predicted DsbA family dithiol-disulfide isomerase
VLLEIWSDIACPWCAIGRARLRRTLADLPYADEVEVRWRSFELDPSAPTSIDGTYVDRLARKYDIGGPDAQAMLDEITETAADEGLAFRFDIIRPGNTLDAHRLIHLGATHGLQDAVKGRLFRGYMEEGEPIADHAALRRMAVDAGLGSTEVDEVLASDRFRDAVRHDEATADDHGIRGVPFFVFDRRFGLSGAQPPETLRKVLDHARAEAQGAPDLDVGHDHDDGDACSDGACAM